MLSSKGSSRPRDPNPVSLMPPALAARFLTASGSWEEHPLPTLAQTCQNWERELPFLSEQMRAFLPSCASQSLCLLPTLPALSTCSLCPVLPWVDNAHSPRRPSSTPGPRVEPSCLSPGLLLSDSFPPSSGFHWVGSVCALDQKPLRTRTMTITFTGAPPALAQSQEQRDALDKYLPKVKMIELGNE